MALTRIGLDLAKNVFEVHGVDERDKTVLRKTLRRDQVGIFFANISPCLVAMEACSGAHYWAREIADLGHATHLSNLMSKQTRATRMMQEQYARRPVDPACVLLQLKPVNN